MSSLGKAEVKGLVGVGGYDSDAMVGPLLSLQNIQHNVRTSKDIKDNPWKFLKT